LVKIAFTEEQNELDVELNKLIDEAEQLKRIFSAIVVKLQ
jgi:hypothetical protein